MSISKAATVVNGFIHDFAAGYWLAAICAISFLHAAHTDHVESIRVLNRIEQSFFWHSVAAVMLILATGAGRTFTYVDNFYGPDHERTRRRMLLVKHLVLLVAFGTGYAFVWRKVFH